MIGVGGHYVNATMIEATLRSEGRVVAESIFDPVDVSLVVAALAARERVRRAGVPS